MGVSFDVNEMVPEVIVRLTPTQYDRLMVKAHRVGLDVDEYLRLGLVQLILRESAADQEECHG